jgi:hypothetical protein
MRSPSTKSSGCYGGVLRPHAGARGHGADHAVNDGTLSRKSFESASWKPRAASMSTGSWSCLGTQIRVQLDDWMLNVASQRCSCHWTGARTRSIAERMVSVRRRRLDVLPLSSRPDRVGSGAPYVPGQELVDSIHRVFGDSSTPRAGTLRDPGH